MKAGSELRLQVSERAGRRCEYCLIHEEDSAFSHEVDHVISIQHGGSTEPGNLAFACLFCNRFKGTNIASFDKSGVLVRLFDPRRCLWGDHFRLEGAVIEPLTPEGAVTARLLKLNSSERVLERILLQRLGAYPRT